MKEDDDFCTSDYDDAVNHKHLGREHRVIEIDLIDNDIDAREVVEGPELVDLGYGEEE